jgi:hypothetical protein
VHFRFWSQPADVEPERLVADAGYLVVATEAVVEAEAAEHGDAAAEAPSDESQAAEPELAADAGGDVVEEAEPAEPAAERAAADAAGSGAPSPPAGATDTTSPMATPPGRRCCRCAASTPSAPWS